MSTSRSSVFSFALVIAIFGTQAPACAGDPFRAGPSAASDDGPEPCPALSAAPSHPARTPHRSPAPIGALPPPPASSSAPGVLKLPPKDSPAAPGPEPMPPPETEPWDYVTDIRLWSDPMTEDGVVPLARGALNPTKILAISAMGLPNGDYFEVGGSFHWLSDAPGRASVGGMMGPQDNVAIAFGHWDLFDSGEPTEPITRIQTCVLNDCPASAPNCPTSVCAEIHAAGVVNFEGAWLLDGGGFCGDTVVLTQDGRTIDDLDGLLKHGQILHKTVSFDRYDVHYEGVLAWDREHIEGLAWETMTLTPMSPWTATRIPSPLSSRIFPIHGVCSPCAGFSLDDIPC